MYMTQPPFSVISISCVISENENGHAFSIADIVLKVKQLYSECEVHDSDPHSTNKVASKTKVRLFEYVLCLLLTCTTFRAGQPKDK